MATKKVEHPTLAERHEVGKAARERIPRLSHEGWTPADDRPDPVALLEEQDETREQDLVPVRHGRMMVSPFTFYRGAARIMAADLKDVPRSGLDVQLCGDAHLSNFGVFASPERTLLFDLNDFDETLPGPFEYDVARLAASLTIAAQNDGFTKDDARAATEASISAYRTAMREFAQMNTLEVWYSRLDAESLLAKAATEASKRDQKALARGEKVIAKARTKDSLQALSKLTEVVDGHHRILNQPPVVVPARDLSETYGMSPDEVQAAVHGLLRAYRSTLTDDRRHLLERFELVDFARKVVGVGSVGTRAWIVLLQGRDGEDPLFLQVKQATGRCSRTTFRRAGSGSRASESCRDSG